MVVDCVDLDPEELGHPPLAEPEGLGLVENLDADSATRCGVEENLALGRHWFVAHGSNRPKARHTLGFHRLNGVRLELVVASESIVKTDHPLGLALSHGLEGLWR